MEWQLDWFQKYFSPTCIKGLLNTLCCNIQMLIQAVNSQAWALKPWMSMWWEGSEGQEGSQRCALIQTTEGRNAAPPKSRRSTQLPEQGLSAEKLQLSELNEKPRYA